MTKVVQTELHRHLDVSTRVETLYELAVERGFEAQSTSLSSFREKVLIRKPMTDLRHVLDQFTLFQRVLDRPEILERVAFEAAEDVYREGTRRVEFRFAPSFVCEKKSLTWNEALESFERGLARARQKYADLETGLICIGVRDFSVEEVAQTADFFLENQKHFVAFDLAGNEDKNSPKVYASIFKRLQAAGANITVHAGEGAGAENIWEAVDILGAKRIGHGIRSIEDPKLVEELARRKICLEICPTSNWLTRCVTDLRHHPLPKILRAGVPVCINTDDPGIFGVTMSGEVEICKKQMGLTDSEVTKCFENAYLYSFIQ
jgi:adenosine deaminase